MRREARMSAESFSEHTVFRASCEECGWHIDWVESSNGKQGGLIAEARMHTADTSHITAVETTTTRKYRWRER